MLEIGWVVLWYFASAVLGILSFPILYVICTKLPDRGYAISRVVGLLTAGWVIWLLGTIGLHPTAGFLIGFGLLAALSGFVYYRNAKSMHAFVKEKWKHLLMLEIIFFAAFLSFSWVRSLSPAISGAEKFMDYAIFTTAHQADGLPLGDVWNSNEPLMYHWFGHFLLGLFSKHIGVPSAIGYNLSLAYLFALTVMIGFGLSLTLTKKWYWALLGVGFVAIFGNFAGAIQLAQGPWQDFNIWNPTRVIDGANDGTINEFPFFSFWWGDLHAHVIAIPIVLALLVLMLQMFRAGIDWRMGLLTTFMLGGLRVANAWDWPSVMFTLLVVLVWRWWTADRKRSVFLSVLLPLAAIGGLSLLMFYGFPRAALLEIEFTTIKSLTKEWFLVFGPFALITMLYLPGFFKKYGWLVAPLLVVALFGVPVWLFIVILIAALLAILILENLPEDNVFAHLLTIAGFCILAGVEIVYLKDWLSGGHQRMNTVFKFGLHAWLLLGIAMPVLSQWTWEKVPKARPLQATVLGVILLGSLAYPITAVAQHTTREDVRTLDGTYQIKNQHPEDWSGIEWLLENVKGDVVVLEAPGESYTYGNRVSTHTGLPTVVGWPSHLYQHGVEWDYIYELRDDVDIIYNSTTIEEAMPLIKEHDVKYIFVGDVERDKYPAEGFEKFNELAKAFERGEMVIYRVD